MPFLMVCLVGLLVSVDASPVSPPVISGQVRLPEGSPVAGAQVVLFDVADLRRGPVGKATTDETGQFALPLAAGTAWVLPSEVALGQNYPNPFNPSTLIPYQLSASSPVRLEVFNILGQRVTTLVDGQQGAGAYVARWDGTDAAGSGGRLGGVFLPLDRGRCALDGEDGAVGWAGGGAAGWGACGGGAAGSGIGIVCDVWVGGFGGGAGYVCGRGLCRRGGSGAGGAGGGGGTECAGKVVATLEGMLGDVNADGHVDHGRRAAGGHV